MLHQERAIKSKKQATRDNNKAESERKDSALTGQDDASIAEKAVLPWKNFPLPPGPRGFGVGLAEGGLRGHGQRSGVDLLVLAALHLRGNGRMNFELLFTDSQLFYRYSMRFCHSLTNNWLPSL